MQDYQVELETFRGPLDLLLFLVKRHEVDIFDIPIAKITDQFVEINGNETAQPEPKNAAAYRDLQTLQDKASLALREVFDLHRTFVLR